MIRYLNQNKVNMGVLLLIAPWFERQLLFAENATIRTDAVASAIRETTRKEFKRSRFCKPRSVEPISKFQVFAPLIVEELLEDATSTPPMGLVDPITKRSVLEPVTVYYREAKVESDGLTLDQFIYVWAYEREVSNDESTKDPIVRGVRVILGSDGMPMVWEALEPGGPRVFYVSSSVEAAARAQFGDPLPGCHYSIERSLGDGPAVVVARVLDEGPAPMGPYVYIESSPGRNISTVLCRCSPSQFDDATEIVRYELLPLENVSETWNNRLLGEWIESSVVQTKPLDTLLRWPKVKP